MENYEGDPDHGARTVGQYFKGTRISHDFRLLTRGSRITTARSASRFITMTTVAERKVIA
jgi:hypothetical protein